jgi:hypothetical protein
VSRYESAEIYRFHLQSSEPNFYGRMPHILSYLTYDHTDAETGIITVRKLSVHAKELYRVIKQIASDTGKCWANRDTLAELCNVGAGTITKAKDELLQAFHQLEGNPLIQVTKKPKKTVKEGKILNSTVYDTIVVLDIWKFNNAFMKTRAYHNCEAPSCDDSVEEAPSCDDSARQRAPSAHDTNKNPISITHLSNEQQPTAVADPVCSLKTKKRLFPSDAKKQAYEWLIKQGWVESTAYRLSINYTTQDLVSASGYMQEMIKKKKKEILNKQKYLQTVLNERFWEKRK